MQKERLDLLIFVFMSRGVWMKNTKKRERKKQEQQSLIGEKLIICSCQFTELALEVKDLFLKKMHD